MPPPAPAAPPQPREPLRRLGALLRGAGYHDCLPGGPLLPRRRLREARVVLPPLLRSLLDLLLLGETVPQGELEGALPEDLTGALRHVGLLGARRGGLHARGRALLPLGDLLLLLPAADLRGGLRRDLLRAALGLCPPPGARVLEIGGPGALALRAALRAGHGILLQGDALRRRGVALSAAVLGVADGLRALEPTRLPASAGPFDLIAAGPVWPPLGPGGPDGLAPVRWLLAQLDRLAPGGSALALGACRGADEGPASLTALAERARARGFQVVLSFEAGRRLEPGDPAREELAQEPGAGGDLGTLPGRLFPYRLRLLRAPAPRVVRMGPLLPTGFLGQAARTLRELPVLPLCHRHGLPPPAPEDLRKAGGTAVILGPARVLKVAAPQLRAALRVEQVALRYLHGRLPVATPAVLAGGEEQGWPYLLLGRLPGRPAAALQPHLSPPERRAVAAELGRLLRQLHELPAPPDPELDRDFTGYLRGRRGACLAHHLRLGAPPAWLGDAPVWIDEVLGSRQGRPAVLLHGDLTDSNVLLERRGAAWAVAGLCDFGDARLGDGLCDLVAPALTLCRGDPGALQALLRAHGLRWPDAGLQRRLMGYALLLESVDLVAALARVPTRRVPARLEDLAAVLLPLG